MEKLLGVVLCGGESKRMGADKGLLPAGDTVRARYVAAKLASFDIPVVYSVNATQVKDYAVHIPAGQLITDDGDVKGPLKGLLSVQHHFPGKNLLLLACDMLDMDGETLRHLLQVYAQEPGFDFYVFQDAAYAQPFCGIYTAGGLEKVVQEEGAHALTNFSLQSVLDKGRTKRIPIRDPAAFRNYNTAAGDP